MQTTEQGNLDQVTLDIAAALPAQDSTSQGALAIFERLVDAHVINRRTLEEAAEIATGIGHSLGWVLGHHYLVPHHCIGEALSAYYDCPFLGLDQELLPSRDLVDHFDPRLLEEGCWAPLWTTAELIDVLTVDPRSAAEDARLRQAFPGKRIHFYVGLREDVLKCIAALRAFSVAPSAP